MAKAISKKSFDFWHSRQGYAAEAMVCVALAYVVASLAINSGSLIQYFVTFVLIGIAIKLVVKIFKK